MSPAPRIPGSVAEVRGSEAGPQVTAFFDVDGTIVAGFTVNIYTKAGLRSRDIGVTDFMRMLTLSLSYQAGATAFEEVVQQASGVFKGRSPQELHDLGGRVFEAKVADLLYPETRALVRAHQEQDHRVVLCSSATSMQVEPIAEYLGVEDVVCNQFEVGPDGLLTGRLVEPVIWGEGKAVAAQRFARAEDIDLSKAYFYADGDEDVALMHMVGNPRPTNPGPELTKVANKRGWPITRHTTRGIDSRESLLRNVIGISSLGPIASAATAVGVLTRNRRRAVNMVTGLWPRTLLEAQGVQLRVTGSENAEHRPAVFIFNHRTAMDSFIVGAVIKTDFTAVAKKELKTNPIFGTLGRAMDMAFIDRADSESAVNAMKEVERLVERGISIVVSPEGHRFDTHEVGPFKKGAFRMAMSVGVPVIPVVIRNADDVSARESLTVNPGVVDVTILPPIDVSTWQVSELTERIEQVRTTFIETLRDWPQEVDIRD